MADVNFVRGYLLSLGLNKKDKMKVTIQASMSRKYIVTGKHCQSINFVIVNLIHVFV